MDFLVCKCGLQGLSIHIPLEDIASQEEAISKARDIAMKTKEGATVGLFTRDANAICGWKICKSGKLRDESAEQIKYFCDVGPGSFDFAKKQADELRRFHEDKEK